MSRHAKAPSAGQNSSQVSGLGSFLRGAFATRGVSEEVRGSGAPSHRTRAQVLALVCAVAMASMALLASSALAAKTHPYTGTSFGPDGVGGSASFNNLQSIAVDQASGNVFAYDAGAEKVYKFNASGAPVNFSALAGNAISGVGGGGGNGEYEIAVAPAGSPGGTAGDIYVANNSNSLKIYSPTGASLGELAIGGETCGVAVNPAGRLFVGVYSSTVKEFTPSDNPPTADDESGQSSGVVSAICSVAADGLGNVYATAYFGGNLFKLEGLSDPTATIVDPATATMAIDSSSNDVYADRGSTIAQYSSAGALIGTSGSGQLVASRGVAVNGAAGTIYAGNGGSDKIDVFGPPIIVPGVSAQPPTAVGAKKATLHGTVNPAGLAVSECKFEYGPSESYGQSLPCEGAIPTDEADHPVSAALTGLNSNTTYHFRIVATNANGSGESADQTFATSPPVVTKEATAITGSHATLNGTVFPEGEVVTECAFEYGPTEALGSAVPCDQAVPADEEGHAVTASLTHLIPNEHTYFFRLVVNGTQQGGTLYFFTKNAVITGEATAIAADGATLNGTVNPEGTLYTECTFEYGVSTAYGQSVPCAESPATIGTGSSPVAIHVDLTGLELATVYHYRLVGTKGDGAAAGGDRTFKTLSPPVIEAEWATSVESTEATLKSTINPEGFATTYHIEYGTDTSYGTSTAESNVGSNSTGRTLTNSLQGLTPGTAYHWRAVATNSIGTANGPDRTFNTGGIPVGNEESCPNQAFRIGASANLPDCRAYEMVTPVDKDNADIITRINFTGYPTNLDQSSTDGSKFTYSSYRAFADPKSAPYTNQYFARRDPGLGWLTESIDPPRSGHFRSGFFENEYQAFSADLSSGWLLQEGEPTLAPCAPAGFNDLYHRDSASGAYRALSCAEPTVLAPVEYVPELQGFSADGSHTLVRVNEALTPDASNAGNYQLYESTGSGELHLVSVLPNGEATIRHASAGTNIEADTENHNRYGSVDHAMSDDGSRVFWSTAGFAEMGPLYLRINADSEQSLSGACDEAGKACTIEVSSQPSRFQTANRAGTKALFLVSREGGSFNRDFDLYEFDGEAEPPASHLLAEHTIRNILGASEDLSRVFFVSEEASGQAQAEGAIPGRSNIYLADQGATRFVATLTSADGANPAANALVPVERNSRVSADGQHLVFMSNSKELSERAAGYDNTDAVSGEPDAEVYLYDATANSGEGKLRCVSCNPSGARPQGHLLVPDGGGVGPGYWGAASVPVFQTQLFQPRYLSGDGGRVFFNSFDALVLGDTNGKQDVYEWEAPGSGNCTTEISAYVVTSEGCLRLLSSGKSVSNSEFFDANPSGTDVFFTTAEGLLPQDYGLIDVYDAREGGGFPPPPNPPAACEGEACQSPLEAPNDPTPASAAFKGAGNVKEGGKSRCAKGKARKKGRCVAKKHKKPAAKKSAKRRANDNRRAGR